MIVQIDLPPGPLPAVVFGAGPVSLHDVVALAARRARPVLSGDPVFVARIDAGAALLERSLRADGVVHGVTTGFGDSRDTTLPPAPADELPQRLLNYHGCGLGIPFTPEQTRAILAVRLASLCGGESGVSMDLLRALVALLDHDILPVIPSEGSVGASGDLTPLSYVAAVLTGQREVWRDGAQAPAMAALKAAGLRPLRLRPKEGLALMNGTAAMTGLACLAAARAESLCRLASRITALSAVALEVNAGRFDEALFAASPYPGMARVAEWLRSDLSDLADEETRTSPRLQDRDAIRCAPHVIGVLIDALPWMGQQIELELNSANDYGAHMAFAMDGMKNAVANLADLLDRQMALLAEARYNKGLKGLQTGASAWTAEALKQTMPASVLSRSGMGTIAARDCLRVTELTEQVAAALLIALRQACAQRHPAGLPRRLGAGLRSSFERIAELVPSVIEDRRLDHDLRRLLAVIRYDGAALLCRGAAEAAASS
jgi:histidine ammonia-lyase